MSAHSSLDQALITTVGGSLCAADKPQCFSTSLALFLPNVAPRGRPQGSVPACTLRWEALGGLNCSVFL